MCNVHAGWGGVTVSSLTHDGSPGLETLVAEVSSLKHEDDWQQGSWGKKQWNLNDIAVTSQCQINCLDFLTKLGLSHCDVIYQYLMGKANLASERV